MHRIGIIGLGYVGSACEINFSGIPRTQVSVYDKYKPTESLHTVVENSDILFICVPTPMLKTGECDTSIVETCIRQINSSNTHKIIVIKSSIVPGTTKRLQAITKHDLFFNPEFLTQANFIEDFANQEHIVLGHSNNSKSIKLELFYKDFIKNQKHTKGKIIWTDATLAELMKYTINCFLATKVTYFNEIRELCDTLDADYDKLVALVQNDERIGDSHLNVPGPDKQFGFGGKCFPANINALIYQAREYGLDPIVLESIWTKNLLIREDYDWERIPGATYLKKSG